MLASVLIFLKSSKRSGWFMRDATAAMEEGFVRTPVRLCHIIHAIVNVIIAMNDSRPCRARSTVTLTESRGGQHGCKVSLKSGVSHLYVESRKNTSEDRGPRTITAT